MISTPLYAIIVAGGSGTRMNSDIPKQFLSIAGKPILMHTIDAFRNWNKSVKIILVLPQNQMTMWEKLCLEHDFEYSTIDIALGGSNRFESVKNGLLHVVGNDGLVAIHDGVRPLVSSNIIAESYTTALEKGNAIVAVPLKDSVRKISGSENISVNRDDYQLVQTPQTFLVAQLKNAFEKTNSDANNFTDDASVVENMGLKINLINGSYENIKVTTPEDLLVAEALLLKRTSNG